MKRPNITPGKWTKSEKDRHGLWIENDGDEPEEICMVSAATVSYPEFRANVKAIAAVPKLLMALETFPEFPDDFHPSNPDSVEAFAEAVTRWKEEQARKALTKAGYEFP